MDNIESLLHGFTIAVTLPHLGLMLIGVLLGPSLLNYFHLPWFTDAHLAETVKRLALRAHRERWGLFLMKGAERLKIGSRAFQGKI